MSPSKASKLLIAPGLEMALSWVKQRLLWLWKGLQNPNSQHSNEASHQFQPRSTCQGSCRGLLHCFLDLYGLNWVSRGAPKLSELLLGLVISKTPRYQNSQHCTTKSKPFPATPNSNKSNQGVPDMPTGLQTTQISPL